jgi:hypothetical protein
LVEDSYAKPGTDTFIRLIGDQGSNRFIFNDISNAKTELKKY